MKKGSEESFTPGDKFKFELENKAKKDRCFNGTKHRLVRFARHADGMKPGFKIWGERTLQAQPGPDSTIKLILNPIFQERAGDISCNHAFQIISSSTAGFGYCLWECKCGALRRSM